MQLSWVVLWRAALPASVVSRAVAVGRIRRLFLFNLLQIEDKEIVYVVLVSPFCLLIEYKCGLLTVQRQNMSVSDISKYSLFFDEFPRNT